MELAGLYIYAYLVGAVPTAYIIGRLVKGIDIRQYGSGNVGGTNVFYNVGKFWVVPLGLFELFVKSGSPVWIGMYLLDNLDRASPALVGAPLVAIAGNNWSPFLKFTGGRGMAVVIGALLALAKVELAVFAVVAVTGWVIFRSSGVWAYIALLVLPFSSLLLKEPLAITWLCVGVLALVSAKRLTSNWNPLPEGMSKWAVLFNRLIRDRDVASREEWQGRGPRGKGGGIN